MATFLDELLRAAGITDDRHASAQNAWQQSEWIARAAFALTRLDALDALGPRLTSADRFDAAYAIWDDYIDGRRDDERIDEASAVELTEAAMIFARVARYLDSGNVVALARAAWGRRVFEVFLFNAPGDREATGKFCWYPQQETVAVLRSAIECRCGQTHPGISDTYTPRGIVRTSVRHARPIALHPVFGARS